MIETIHDLVRFLRHFHRRWRTETTLDPTCLAHDLPSGLSEIYRELGALVEITKTAENYFRAPFAGQDILIPASRLARVDGMFEFACENQGNWSARCPSNVDDPPVFSNTADIWDSEASGYQVVCNSLNHFLTTLCLQEAVMSCSSLLVLGTDGVDKIFAVEADPLWIQGRYVYSEPTHSFYELLGEDALVMDYAGIWLGCTQEDGDRLIQADINYKRIR